MSDGLINIFSIALGAILVNNFIFSQFQIGRAHV